jgi:hypothetical protein
MECVLLGALPILPNLVGAAFTWLPVCHVVNRLVQAVQEWVDVMRVTYFTYSSLVIWLTRTGLHTQT